MANWKKILLPAVLVLAVALPSTSAFAADAGRVSQTAARPNIGQWFKHQVGKDSAFLKNVRNKVSGAFHVGTNKKEYMLLLAEKYTPESVEAWNAAFAEHDKLVEELKQLGAGSQYKDEAKAKLQNLKNEYQSGQITREQAVQQLKQWKQNGQNGLQAWKDQHGADLASFMKERKALIETFTKAIQSGSADEIKAVMPKMLAEVVKDNQMLANKLTELKQNP